jgi:hypothetical protein
MIGTIRRECLDWLIPMSEAHLRAILKDWRPYYNGSRPHMALGPGVPDPPAAPTLASEENSPHRLGERLVARARSVLGGLHHEYSLRLIEYLRTTTQPHRRLLCHPVEPNQHAATSCTRWSISSARHDLFPRSQRPGGARHQ